MGNTIDRITEFDIQRISIKPPESKKPVYKVPQVVTNYDNRVGDYKPKKDFIDNIVGPSTPVNPPPAHIVLTRVFTFMLTEDSEIGGQQEVIKCPWDCTLVKVQFTSEELKAAGTLVNIERCDEASYETGTTVWSLLLQQPVVLSKSNLCTSVDTHIVIHKGDYLRLNTLTNNIIKSITVELMLTQEI